MAEFSPVIIRSTQNPLYRHCLKLRENRKRRRLGQILIDGTSEICRAVRAGVEVHRILASSELELPSCLVELLKEYPGVGLQLLTPPLLRKLCYGQVESDPVAVASEPNWELGQISPKPDSLFLVLDRTEKPGNLGACIRTAVACGCSAVFVTRPVCDVFCANSIRASRGTIFDLPIVVSTPEKLIELSREWKMAIFAARTVQSQSLWNIDLSRGAFLVFGNETEGLDETWLHERVKAFSIPMLGPVDSLNLSISAAVTLYEAVRQKECRRFDRSNG